MQTITNSQTYRYSLPDGNIYEYEINYFSKMVYGRIYNQNGRKIASARQGIWPWTKIYSPEEMLNKVRSNM